MTTYEDDRSFTNYVHEHLAIPKIYKKLGWVVKDIDPDELDRMDVDECIDFVLIDTDDNEVFVQERFRDAYYKNYNDATLRYKREENTDPDRRKSEFFKIKSKYLVYGITNGKKI